MIEEKEEELVKIVRFHPTQDSNKVLIRKRFSRYNGNEVLTTKSLGIPLGGRIEISSC